LLLGAFLYIRQDVIRYTKGETLGSRTSLIVIRKAFGADSSHTQDGKGRRLKASMNIRDWLRKPFANTKYAAQVDLSGRHMIVTGCSDGSLGYETAKQLALWGATVIITTRGNTAQVVDALRSQLGEAAKSSVIDGHALELSDTSSVNQFTQWYRQHYGKRLDALVSNAGIHLDLMSQWKTPRLSRDGHEIHWRTNYLGTVQLTSNLLSLLKNTGQEVGEARVVNVISQLHSRGTNELLFDQDRTYESWQAYGLSKLALFHFTTELDRRYSQSHNLKSFCLHPAGRSGASTNVAAKGLEGHNLIGLLRKVGSPLEKLLLATAAEGAQTQIHCATASIAKSGQYYVNCAIGRASDDSQDRNAAERLWRETRAWLDQSTV